MPQPFQDVIDLRAAVRGEGFRLPPGIDWIRHLCLGDAGQGYGFLGALSYMGTGDESQVNKEFESHGEGFFFPDHPPKLFCGLSLMIEKCCCIFYPKR